CECGFISEIELVGHAQYHDWSENISHDTPRKTAVSTHDIAQAPLSANIHNPFDVEYSNHLQSSFQSEEPSVTLKDALAVIGDDPLHNLATHSRSFDLLTESSPMDDNVSRTTETGGQSSSSSCAHTVPTFSTAVESPCLVCGHEVWRIIQWQNFSVYLDREFNIKQVNQKYSCTATNCRQTFGHWDDLKRHIKTFHCLHAVIYPCEYIGCKYGGANGFKRKDKLKSHQRNVHLGKALPGGAPKVIKAKPAE
ncbi:hypothetical protein MMC14_003878, partial [Varicellaria rhodocarpa]|nr:hypothetical protein [Varicellaria rhodocarpa]